MGNELRRFEESGCLPKPGTCGRQTEVYSRVVGYHRPVKNWHNGKREEFKDRREFSNGKATAPSYDSGLVKSYEEAREGRI